MATKKKLTAEEAAAKEKESVQVTLHIFKVLGSVALIALAISLIAFCFTGCDEMSSILNDTELSKLFDEVGETESAFLALEGNSYKYDGEAITVESSEVFTFTVKVEDNVAYLVSNGTPYPFTESGSSISIGSYSVQISDESIIFKCDSDKYEYKKLEENE